MATEDTNLDNTTPEEFVPPHKEKGTAAEKFADVISTEDTPIEGDPALLMQNPEEGGEDEPVQNPAEELPIEGEPIPQIPADQVEVDGVTGPARKVQQLEPEAVDEKPLPHPRDDKSGSMPSWDAFIKKGANATAEALSDVGKEMFGEDLTPVQYPASPLPDFATGVLHSAFEGTSEFYVNLGGEGINSLTSIFNDEAVKRYGPDSGFNIPQFGRFDFVDYVPPEDRSFIGTMSHEILTLGVGALGGGGPIRQTFKWGTKGTKVATNLIKGGSKKVAEITAKRIPGAGYMGSKAVTTTDKAYDLFVSLGNTTVGKGGKWVAQKGVAGSKLGFQMDMLRTSHATVFDLLPPGMSKEFMRSDTLDRSVFEERLTQGAEGFIFGLLGGPILSGVFKGVGKGRDAITKTEGYKKFVAYNIKPFAVKLHTAHQLRRLFKNETLTQAEIKAELARIHKDNLTGIADADKAQKVYLKEQQVAAIERQKARRQGKIEERIKADDAEAKRAVDELYLNTKHKKPLDTEGDRSVREVGSVEPKTEPKPKLDRKGVNRPHTMTPTEYLEKLGPDKVEEMGGIKEVMAQHKEAVDVALTDGKTVHKIVVDKYPDLKETHFGDDIRPEIDVQTVLSKARRMDNKSNSKTPDYHLRQVAKHYGIEVKDVDGNWIKRGRLEEEIADFYGQPVGKGQGRRRAESTVEQPEQAVWTYTDDPELQQILRDSADDAEFLEIMAGKQGQPDNVRIAELENEFEMDGFLSVEGAEITAAQAREAGRAVTLLQYNVTKRLERLKTLNDEFQELAADEGTSEDTLVQMITDMHELQREARRVYAHSERATSEIGATLRLTQLTKSETPFKSEGFGVIESKEEMEKFLLALGGGDMNKGIKIHAKHTMMAMSLEDTAAIVKSDPSYAKLLTNVYSQDVINSMLSSPQTAIINAASPFATIAIDFVESTVGALARGEGRRAWINTKAHLEFATGLPRAMRIAWQTLRTNKSSFDAASRLNEPLQEGLESGNRVSSRAGFEVSDRTKLSNFFDFIAFTQSGATRGLGAVDDFWKSLIYQQKTRAAIEVNLVKKFKDETQSSYERIRLLADAEHKDYVDLDDKELVFLARAEAEEKVLQNLSIEAKAASDHAVLMKQTGQYTHQKAGEAALRNADAALETGEISRSEYTQFLADYMRDNFDQSLVEASKEGLDQARRLTFTTPLERGLREGFDPSRPEGSAGSIASGVGKANKAIEEFNFIGPLMRTQIPFVRTPFNIIEWLTVRKPQYAVPKAIKEIVRDLNGMNGTPAQQEMARRTFGRVLTSLGFTYKAYDLALQGRITGAGPSDNETRKQWEATGWKPHSFVSDDGKTYTPLVRLAPFSGPMMSAGETVEFMRATEGLGEDGRLNMDSATLKQFVVRDVISVAEMAKEFPFLQGLSQGFKAMEGSDAQRGQIFRNISRQTMPYASGFRSFNQADIKREQQDYMDAYRSNLPWTEGYDGPAARGVYHKPVRRNKVKSGDTWMGVMKDAFNPVRSSTVTGDNRVAEEMRRITTGKRAGERGKQTGGKGEVWEGEPVSSPFQPLPREISVGGVPLDLKDVKVDITETIDGETRTNQGTYWHLLGQMTWELQVEQDVVKIVTDKNGLPKEVRTKVSMNVEEAIENLMDTQSVIDKLDENGKKTRTLSGLVDKEVVNPYANMNEFDGREPSAPSKATLINAVIKGYREIAKANFIEKALKSNDPKMEKMGLYFWLGLGQKVSALKGDRESVDKYFNWIDELKRGDASFEDNISELKNQVQLEMTNQNK
tara:strand:- start:9286 stop:14625 length:5340 start_codon:yes stop_codon:yes gene_type:complete